MDNKSYTRIKPNTLEYCFKDVCTDTDNLFKELTDTPTSIGSEIVIQTDLPSRVDPDFLIGMVRRWYDIQNQYNRPLRIIAWSYNPKTEKHMLGLVQNIPNVFLTVLPAEMRYLSSGQNEVAAL